MAPAQHEAFRLLPAVDEALGRADVAAALAGLPRALATSFVQEALEGLRARIRAGALDLEGARAALGALGEALAERARRERASGLVRAINATGVVLHTGLGRAPVHPEAAAAMARAAGGYCVLEVDRLSNERNERDARLSELACRLLGAEAAIAVNNNAAAVLLALNTFAQGRATLVSRGELVEIGGSFRMPSIMERAGTRLVEVGTTNRTRLEDYRAALGPDAGLLLKVHTSNFRVVGFTAEVGAAELARLGAESGVRTVYDVGSGLVEPEGAPPLGLGGEPLVREALASGVDVVLFSGDKLLGAPQAGLALGRREALRALRANPLYRALRLDKVALAGLERTLELYLEGRAGELPARALLGADPARLRAEAAAIAAALARLPGLEAHVEDGLSQPGSGSAPGVGLATSVVRVQSARLSSEALAGRLRAGSPPVFARLHEGALVLDPRALLPGEREELVAAFEAAAAAAPAARRASS